MALMNKLNHGAAAALAALTLSACATVTSGAQGPLPVDPQIAARAHVGVVRMTSGWVNANQEFGGTFADALHENLAHCAQGPERLDLNVHVDRVRRADRIASLFRGGGTHQIAATAELVEPKTKRVVGRYPIHVLVDAGNPLEVVLSDRQLMVSDAFATQLCKEAFGA
jgi:hypothetical protein